MLKCVAFVSLLVGVALSTTYVRVNQVAYRVHDAKVAVALSSVALSQSATFQVVEQETGFF